MVLRSIGSTTLGDIAASSKRKLAPKAEIRAGGNNAKSNPRFAAPAEKHPE